MSSLSMCRKPLGTLGPHTKEGLPPMSEVAFGQGGRDQVGTHPAWQLGTATAAPVLVYLTGILLRV